MKTILGVVIVLAVFNCAYSEEDKEWIDFRLLLDDNDDNSQEVTTPASETCTEPGPKCGKDCKTLYFCHKVGDGWDIEELDKCNVTCSNKQCSTTPSLECALINTKFECKSLEGMYPDPTSCKKFNYCVPKNADLDVISSECKGSWGYNPRTTYCDVILRNNTCGVSSIPLCSQPGQTGALKENPTLYYTCRRYQPGSSVLYPNLYMCENGKKYNEKLYICQ